MNKPITGTTLLAVILLAGSAALGQPTNVALGVAITPLTNTIQGSPSLVTDGDFGDAWYSYQGGWYNTCSFTIDLGTQYSIQSIKIGQNQVYGYQVYSSNNGTDWTLRQQVDYGSSQYNQVQIDVNGAYQARYLKYFAYANWNQYVGVTEFEVYSGNAAAKPAAAVPAVSTWAAIGLGIMLAGSGLWMLRRRAA